MEQEFRVGEERQNNRHEYTKFPENIRQVGESGGICRLYIEDYVVTYMKRIFQEKQENAILILVGSYGKGVVSGCPFVYGAVLLETDVLDGVSAITAQKWGEANCQIQEHFAGAEILGWAFGVNIWNSHIDRIILQIQKKYFRQEGKALFLTDLSEKEEKIFLWKNGNLQPQPGYVVYYEKNKQMQDYMLGDEEKESFEAEYHDKVTDEIREVIGRKEAWRKNKQQYMFGGFAMVVLFALVLGGNILLGSLSKIASLEQSIAAMKTDIESSTKQDSGSAEGIEVSGSSKRKTTDVKQAMSDNQPDKGEKEQGNSSKEGEDGKQGAGGGTQKPSASETPKQSGKPKETAAAGSNTQGRQGSAGSKGNAGGNTAKPALNAGKTPSLETTPSPTIKKAGKKNTNVAALGKKYDSYIVQKGDTLSQIVWKQYHSFEHMNTVRKINKIENKDEIYQGQCIILPRFAD